MVLVAEQAVVTGEHDRLEHVQEIPDFVAEFWRPRFPSPELVEQATALLPVIHAVPGVELAEGPWHFVRVGPGVVQVGTRDFARADRAYERELHDHQVDSELLAAYLEEHGHLPDQHPPRGRITEWSRKSRANMVRTFGLLDFTPMFADPSRLPAAVTLTYPGEWQVVASNGVAVYRHLKMFRQRYERAWGETLRVIWKREFQARDAPHAHFLMTPPHGIVDGMQFRQWLSQTWADVVAHPDPEQYRRHLLAGTGVDYLDGLKMTDPKRVAVYFTKHGLYADKEYQNEPPQEWLDSGEPVGRFWGYWGLERRTATAVVTPADGITAGRTLRRWSAAQRPIREVTRPRTKGGRPISKYPEVIGLAGAWLMESRSPPKYRKTRTRARRMRRNVGFVMVNSGPTLVSQLVRYLDQRAGRGDDDRYVFARLSYGVRDWVAA